MKRRKKILLLVIVIIIALLGFAIFKIFNPSVKTPEGQLSDKEIKVLVDKVSKLINIPEEIPVVATIKKADQLIAEQSFYVGSEDGDYLLVFLKAQKAIIYRESKDRLINVGPIVVDQPVNTQPVSNEIKATTTVKATSTKEE